MIQRGRVSMSDRALFQIAKLVRTTTCEVELGWGRATVDDHGVATTWVYYGRVHNEGLVMRIRQIDGRYEIEREYMTDYAPLRERDARELLHARHANRLTVRQLLSPRQHWGVHQVLLHHRASLKTREIRSIVRTDEALAGDRAAMYEVLWEILLLRRAKHTAAIQDGKVRPTQAHLSETERRLARLVRLRDEAREEYDGCEDHEELDDRIEHLSRRISDERQRLDVIRRILTSAAVAA